MECEKFKKEKELEFRCCESCHEDEDLGCGGDLWFDLDDKDWHICCAAERAYKQKHQFEKDRE